MNKVVILLASLLLCMSGVLASSVSVWQGQYYTGTTFNTGTYTFNFTVYDAETGGSACFTNTTSLTTGNWGQWRIEQSPWDSCDNASKEYFLNVNIAGTDQVPRRRLTVSDFLRRDVSSVQEGNLIVNDNVTADYYFGDGRYLVGINGSGDINSVQGDGVYLYNGSDSGNVVLAFNESRLNGTIDVRASVLGDNSSWNESYADMLYYSINNPYGFWNDSYATFNETYADTLYANISLVGDNSSWNESYADGKYLNLSGGNVDQDINISPYNFESSNLTLSQKITFGLGGIIDNIISGWIRVSGGFNVTGNAVVGGDLNVTQNVSAEWFNGLFEWFVEDNSSSFLSFNGSTLSFNGTSLEGEIETGIAASQALYSPINIETVVGTLDGGNLTSVQSINDYDFYNVSETGANPGFVIVVNFTGVEIFNQIYLEEYYDGKSGHTINVQLYNFNSSSYDSFGSIADQVDFRFLSLEVLNSQDYISNSNVSLRIYHDDSGNPNHDIIIDYVALKYDSAGTVITDHGSLSGLSGDDHMQYLKVDGDRPMIGNLNASDYNITSDYVFANGSQMTGVCLSNGTNCQGGADTQKNATGYLYNDSTTIYLNETKLNITIDDRENDTLGDVGACGNEQVVKWNATSSVWYCSDVAAVGAGDIDAVNTNGDYLTGGQTSGSVSLLLNETKLNETISSEGLRLGFNSTFNSTYDSKVSDNVSWNESYAGNLYFKTGENISMTPYNFSAFQFFGFLNASYILNAPWITSAGADTNASTACSSIEVLLGNGSCYDSSVFFDDTDTQKNATGYLYNDSTTVYLNETLLNATIDSRDTNETTRFDNLVGNCSAGEFVFGVDSLGNKVCVSENVGSGNPFDQVLNTTSNVSFARVNATDWSNVSITENQISDLAHTVDTQKNASGYLYNDSTTVYLNETLLNATIDSRAGGDNSSWNESLADGKYYSITNPSGFWNDTYATFNESYADGVYLNLSGGNANQDVNIAPYNFEAANLTLAQNIVFDFGDVIDNIVNTWIRVSGGFNVTNSLIVGQDVNVSGNVTAEEIHFEQDPVNHRIYDNATCIIMQGDTSTMYIC
jgi:CRISPR/Cas system CMR subunit Cmr4 (Cas7 group RAMP superfamily)/cytoskeletal protein CcmA (bactofilin family)